MRDRKDLDWDLYKSRKNKVLCHYFVRVVNAHLPLVVEPCNVFAEEGVQSNRDGTLIQTSSNEVCYFFFAKRFDAEKFVLNPIVKFWEYNDKPIEQLEFAL